MTEAEIEREYALVNKYPGGVTAVTEIRFDFKDRLRVLLTGAVTVRSMLFYEKASPNLRIEPTAETLTLVTTRWPRLWPRPRIGFVVAEKKPDAAH